MFELLVIEEPQKHFDCTSFSTNRNSFTSHYIAKSSMSLPTNELSIPCGKI